jgi:hypothetical protein
MRIDPLLTASPVTGAVRHLTDDLLKEVYLAPMGKPLALQDLLTMDHAPWSESFSAAPSETLAAVEDGLLAVMRATRTLDPSEINLSTLPEGRARTQLRLLIFGVSLMAFLRRCPPWPMCCAVTPIMRSKLCQYSIMCGVLLQILPKMHWPTLC